jgi:hypothetical protein
MGERDDGFGQSEDSSDDVCPRPADEGVIDVNVEDDLPTTRSSSR